MMEQTLKQAITLHQAGKLEEAGKLYLTILQAHPEHAEANHKLGILAVQMQQPAAGLPYFIAALEADPACGQYWLSYIDALYQAGQLEAAREVLALAQKQGLSGDQVEALAVQLNGDVPASVQQPEAVPAPKQKPASPDSAPDSQKVNALLALFNAGQLDKAATMAQELTVRSPRYGFGWLVLGTVLKQMGRSAEALAPMQKAVLLLPENANAHGNLGAIFQDLGRFAEAEASNRKAIQLNPDNAHVYNNLGFTLQSLGRLEESEIALRQAIQLNPDFAEAYNNLGNTLKDMKRLEEAITSYRKVIQFSPNHALAHYNLGVTFQDSGRIEEAEACYRQAIQFNPNSSDAHSNLLFLLNHLPESNQASNLAEAQHYGQMVTAKAASRFTKWICDKQPKRLRIGFVSGDLKDHPVGHFLENLFRQLDPASLELFAYPTIHASDELTERIKPCFSAWKPLAGLSDETAAHLIHNDGIHVLVDLSGHTCGNRLPLFAWKPAPVQATWLGYLGTTGVAEIDYLIADPWTLPETEEAFFTEKIWRLPETYLCFTPPNVEVAVSPLPALANGYVTFGSFNNLTKMNDAVVALWARVLAAVPGSRLYLKSRQFNEASVRQDIIERFAVQGIEMQRLILEGSTPQRAGHLTCYHRMDIALDPFPYPGITTSVESLWMGVPLLTLAGESFLSRQGIGILMNAGLPEWIAESPDDYVARAASHAANLQQLAALRSTLHQQVLDSPIMDAEHFAVHFEAALRGMWRAWHEKAPKYKGM